MYGKADLMKIVGSIDRDSALTTLISIGVPTMFLEWIKVCITIPSFSSFFFFSGSAIPVSRAISFYDSEKPGNSSIFLKVIFLEKGFKARRSPISISTCACDGGAF